MRSGESDGHHCDACELQSREVDPARSGDLVDGRYLVLGPLGGGAMGDVLEVRDVHLDRRIALKLLRATRSSTGRRLFEREAKALASVQHRSVPTIYSFGVHGRTPFFTMELVPGETLAEVVAAHAENAALVPLHRALQIIDRVASALGAVHAAGMLHRDIKPENVIIETDTGRPVLVDFGIASIAEDAPPALLGTAAFMAPEIWRDRSPSVLSDIYALGGLAFELLTGQPVFGAQSVPGLEKAHLNEPPPRVSDVRSELAAFDGFFERALAKEPSDRFPTCAALRTALTHASEGRAPTLESSPPGPDDAIHVLVIDDDPVFARIAQRAVKVAFREANAEISHARDGESALHRAELWLPHLLLLDYNMPGMNGAELLSRIRSLPGGEGVSVVVMSGAIGKEQRWRFSSLGVRAMLEKPASFDALVDVIVQKGRSRGWLPPAVLTRETLEEKK